MRKFAHIFLVLAVCSNSYSQSFKLLFSVPKDSVKIGEKFDVSLTVVHDETKELFFPSPNSRFGKWELMDKNTFPSYYSNDSLVVDSVVYSLRTFDVSDSLPVYLDLFMGEDSVLVRSSVKWIKHKSGLLPGKGNQVLSDNTYEKIPRLFDENVLIAFLLLLVGLGAYVFFVWLPKYLKKKRIEKFVKKHEVFNSSFYFNSSWSNEDWGRFYASWKKDVSSSEKKNVQGFTSRKLATHFNDKNLSLVFRKLEQILYDPDSNVLLEESDFKRLMNLSESKYLNQLTEMNNDK